MTSIKVKFRPSSTIQKEGTLHYQIIHHREVRKLRTGYRLFPNEWNTVLKRINVSAGKNEERRLYLTALKKHIDTDLFKIKECINRLKQENKPYTADRIVKLYSTHEGSYTFLLYGKELLVELKKIGKVRTADTYRNALGSFERFLNDQADIPLEAMDSNLMIAYESWLKGTGICPNTSSYYMRNLRAIYNRAVEQGFVTQQNPFKHVYTGIDKTKKRAVSLDVIREIRDLKLTKKSLVFARDIFLFSFYTRGMSFVDMAFLKKQDLQNGILAYRRNKTGQQLFIKREKTMQELIDKYDTFDTSYLLPVIRNNGVDEWHQYQNAAHRINRNLKQIGKQIGLDIPLTTYVARHAWASIAQSKNVPLSVISKALGHNSEQTTRIYLSSLDTSVVDKANNLILMSI